MKLEEVYEFFLREEFECWRVHKPDGTMERFNALTLLSSFLEAEIELVFAIRLFDEVVGRLKQGISDGDLSREKIHWTVIEALIDFPWTEQDKADPRIRVWRANYDTIYGPDIDGLSASESYVTVRRTAEFRDEILEIVSNCLGQKKPTQVHKELGNTETNAIIDRIVKVIRYCGFWQVRKDFLKIFIQEVSQSSSKGYFPSIEVSDVEILDVVQHVEENLRFAAKTGDVCSSRAGSLIQQSLEDLGQITLRTFGMLPRPNIGQSFPALVDTIKHAQKIGQLKQSVLPEIQALGLSISSAFQRHGVEPARFTEDWDRLRVYLEHGSTEKCPTRQAALLAQKLSNCVSAVLHPDVKIELTPTFSDGSKIEKYLTQVARIFRSRQVEFDLNLPMRWIEFDVDNDYHPLLGLGRRVRAWVCLDDLANEDTTDLCERIKASVKAQQKGLQVVLCRPEHLTILNSSLKKIALTTETCVLAMERGPFEDGVRGLSNVLEPIYKQLISLIPESTAWMGAAPEEFLIELPNELPEYERTTLAQAISLLRKGCAADACVNAARHLEFYVKQFVYSMHWHLSRVGATYHREIGEPISTDAQSVMSYRQYINWMEKAIRASKTKPEIGRAIGDLRPKEQLVDKLKELSKFRNEIIHTDQDVEVHHAVKYINSVSEMISGLYVALHRPKRVVVIEVNKDSMRVVLESHDVPKIIQTMSIKRLKEIEIAPGSCLFLTDLAEEIIPASMVCRCGKKIIKLHRCTAAGDFICGSCELKQGQASTHRADRAWKTMLQRALGENQKQSIPNQQHKGRQHLMDTVKPKPTFRDWLGAIGEAVAHVAIHTEPLLGGTLKGLLFIKDEKEKQQINQRIETALSSQARLTEELKALIQTTVANKEAESTHLAEVLAHFLNETYAKSSDLDKAFQQIKNTNSWPFVGLTSMTEHGLCTELERLVGGDMELFWADLKKTGFPATRVKHTGTPSTDIYNAILMLWGMSALGVYHVVAHFSENYPGSEILRRTKDELLQWVPQKEIGT